jgi:hypothetical protein
MRRIVIALVSASSVLASTGEAQDPRLAIAAAIKSDFAALHPDTSKATGTVWIDTAAVNSQVRALGLAPLSADTFRTLIRRAPVELVGSRDAAVEKGPMNDPRRLALLDTVRRRTPGLDTTRSQLANSGSQTVWVKDAGIYLTVSGVRRVDSNRVDFAVVHMDTIWGYVALGSSTTFYTAIWRNGAWVLTVTGQRVT